MYNLLLKNNFLVNIKWIPTPLIQSEFYLDLQPMKCCTFLKGN